MDIYNVVFLLENGKAKRMDISKDFLIQLIESINLNGKETVFTSKGTYDVTGVVIGETEGKILFL